MKNTSLIRKEVTSKIQYFRLENISVCVKNGKEVKEVGEVVSGHPDRIFACL